MFSLAMMEPSGDEPVDLTKKIPDTAKKTQPRKSVIVASKSKKKENVPKRKAEMQEKRKTKKNVKCRREADNRKIISKFIQKIKKSKQQIPSVPIYQYVKPRLYLYNNPRNKKDQNPPRKSNEIQSSSSSSESSRPKQTDLTADQRTLLDKIDISGLELADNHLERQLSKESGILKGYEGLLDKCTKLSSLVSDNENSRARLKRIEESVKKIVNLKRETERRLVSCKGHLESVTDHRNSLVKIVKNSKFPSRLLKNNSKTEDKEPAGVKISDGGVRNLVAILRNLIPLSQSPEIIGIDYDSDPGRFVDVCTKN